MKGKLKKKREKRYEEGEDKTEGRKLDKKGGKNRKIEERRGKKISEGKRKVRREESILAEMDRK
jgi:hypothetical protein